MFTGSKSRKERNEAHFRQLFKKLGDDELISRLRKGGFSAEARPIAEDELRSRGVEPPAEEISAEPKSNKPWVLPLLFAFIAATVGGANIGAALVGAAGAGMGALVFALAGWWTGMKLALWMRQQDNFFLKLVAVTAAVFFWLVVMGFVALVGLKWNQGL